MPSFTSQDRVSSGRQRALTEADEAERVQDLRATCQALTQAVEVYQGDVLPSCYDEWIIPVRDRLRQAFLRALERLIELLEHERGLRYCDQHRSAPAPA